MQFQPLVRGLSAFWVLVAIIVGGGLFGFVGMVVGVPASVSYTHLDVYKRQVSAREGTTQEKITPLTQAASHP